MTSIENSKKLSHSGNEKDYRREYSKPNGCPIGLTYTETVEYLVELAKGRISIEQGSWFYGLFLDRVMSKAHQSKDWEDVRDRLRAAWWIEEEDIEQQIHLTTFRLGIYYHNFALFRLCVYMRDWLISSQKAMLVLPEGWEIGYRSYYGIGEEKEEFPFGYNILLEQIGDLTHWEAYLFYLRYIANLTLEEIADSVYYTPRNLFYLYNKLLASGKINRSLIDGTTEVTRSKG